MKIVFVGCVLFSNQALVKLISLRANVVGVVTKQKSTFNADFFDLSSVAIQNHIPFKFVNDINHPNNLKWIKDLNPDVILCCGWSSLFKDELIKLPAIGVIGYHPSLLPYNRGRHPLIWAKVLGLKESGSTFFFMDEGADTGDILSQKIFQIDFEDDAEAIYRKMVGTALFQIEEFFPELKSGEFIRIQQNPDLGNSWRKRNKLDGLIDFRMSSVSICNLVRALNKPYPGAHCVFNESDVKIWDVSLMDYTYGHNIEPGKVLSVVENKIVVKTGDGAISLKEHEFTQIPKVGDYIL